MISDFLDFKNFNFNDFRNKIQNFSISFLGITLEFEDILIIALLLFLFLEKNDDYILYLILILLILS